MNLSNVLRTYWWLLKGAWLYVAVAMIMSLVAFISGWQVAVLAHMLCGMGAWLLEMKGSFTRRHPAQPLGVDVALLCFSLPLVIGGPFSLIYYLDESR